MTVILNCHAVGQVVLAQILHGRWWKDHGLVFHAYCARRYRMNSPHLKKQEASNTEKEEDKEERDKGSTYVAPGLQFCLSISQAALQVNVSLVPMPYMLMSRNI